MKRARLRVIFAAALVFSVPALAAPAAAAPATVTATANTQRLDALMAKVKTADAVCDGGCGLIATMEKHGITPALVTSKQLDVLAPGQGQYIVGRLQGNKMFLNADYPDAKLLETVAHEVRHVWQKKEAGAVVAGMSARQALVLSRFREADAFAFGIYFTYQYEKATGKTLVEVPKDPRDIGNMHPYYKMYALFKFDMDLGMPLDAAYRSLLRRTFEHVKNVDYDGDMLEALGKSNIPGLKMDDAAFTAILRKMGTSDFGKSATVLSYWSDDDYTNLDKTGGITPENLARLQKLEAQKPATPKPPTP
jgi:hypothetical protein